MTYLHLLLPAALLKVTAGKSREQGMRHRFGVSDWIRAAVVAAVLLLALCLRGLADDAGIHIPGLPMSSFGGSSMDNLLAVIFVVLALLVLRRRDGPASAGYLLGLGASGWRGPVLVLLCTVPFWISSALTGTVSTDLDVRALIFQSLLFPFAEELVFRGFGFVFPVTGLRWRPWAAALVQAFCFGGIHWLSQHENGSDQATTIFVMTFLGGIVFAALDGLDRYTLWSGLAFHVSLNAAWNVFDDAPAAAGWGWISNALRLVCAALAVGTLWWLRRRRHVLRTSAQRT